MLTGRAEDPLRAAGLWQCRRCKRAEYPNDAAWLDEYLILASYPSVCAHMPAVSLVLDTGAPSSPVITSIADEDLAVAADSVGLGPELELGELDRDFAHGIAAELVLPRRHCAGRNRRDRPCGAWAMPGSLFCRWHPGATDIGPGAA